MGDKIQPQRLQAKNYLRVLAVTAALLSIPLMFMVFDWPVYDPGNPVPERVNWSPFDFVIMGLLITSVGLAYEKLALRFGRPLQRLVAGLVLLMVFLVIWAQLAVGIFGRPFDG